MTAVLSAVIAGLVAIIVSLLTSRAESRNQAKQLRHEIELQEQRLKAELRTEYMAEEAINQLLRKAEPKRTFKAIAARVGGFTDEELRRLLRPAGRTQVPENLERDRTLGTARTKRGGCLAPLPGPRWPARQLPLSVLRRSVSPEYGGGQRAMRSPARAERAGSESTGLGSGVCRHERADRSTRWRYRAPSCIMTCGTADASGHPVLLLAGAPMGAGGFAALAEQFPDRTVVTYDPRGTGLSQRTDGEPPGSPPDVHAGDLRRLIEASGGRPADVFGSSGGAVNALALVAAHPELVRVLLAHEPPAARELPDSQPVLAACANIGEMYQRSGSGPAMAKFIAMVSLPGPVPADFPGQPAPDPAAFGLPSQDDGSRDDPLLGSHMTACPATSTTSARSARHVPASSSASGPSPAR